ncbi:MAG: Imidazole glycerol phosphate synthase subunit HisF [Pseudomonadota bacterium]|jgi:cyclase
MLSKRLIGVITVRDGWAVQSVGYSLYRPLGRPETLAENLDRWGVDEIFVQCIDRGNRGPDLPLLQRLCRQGLSTPLVYAGGVRSVDDGVGAVQAGAERIAIDAWLHDAPHEVAALAERLGAQALIATLPLSLQADGRLAWLDHRNRRSAALSDGVMALLASGHVSEALLVDWCHEGNRGGFDHRLLAAWPVPGLPVIAFGGLDQPDPIRAAFAHPFVAGVAVGNALSHREHAVQHLRGALQELPVRPPRYAPLSATAPWS